MDINNVNSCSSGNTFQTISPEFQTLLSCLAPTSCKPYLSVKNELKKEFKFRYDTDGGSHGGVQPVIELHNYDDPSNIHIKASLYTNEIYPRLHTNFLQGKHCESGVCWTKLSDDFTAEFAALPIFINKKETKKIILKDRILKKYKQQGKIISEENLNKEVEVEVKSFDSNSVRFYFEAFNNKDEGSPICEGIFSHPIINTKKGKGDDKLKISRLSRYAGKISGNEDMILLCQGINKGDIKNLDIVFFSVDNDQNVDWQENVKFRPEDVNFQEVAIPFKTPAFKENVEREVFIQLHKNSDGIKSEALKFQYKHCNEFEPEFIIQQSKKRKKLDLVEDSLSEPSTSFSGAEKTKDVTNLNSYYDSKLQSQFLISEPNKEDSLPSDMLDNDTKNSFKFAWEDMLSSAVPNVSPDGLIDKVTSLTINDTPFDIIPDKGCCTEKEDEKILKNGIIKLIKESKKDEFLRFFLKAISLKDESENNILHLFITEGSGDLCLLLKILEYVPSDLINQINKMDMTPLMIAVTKNLSSIVKILLKFGADPNIKDKDGNTCVHLATYFNFPHCLREVLAPLLSNSKFNYLPDINVLNWNGLSPLHLSVIRNSQMCTKLLLLAKANINITDGKSGKTPLHFAYEESDSELIAFLLTQPGIDTNVKDYSGSIPSLPISETKDCSKLKESCSKISSNSNRCEEDEKCNCEEGNHTMHTHEAKENHTKENEKAFCKILDSNELWKKLGKYVIDKEEFSTIEFIDASPTRTILNQLKKLYGENYDEKLKYILKDVELKQYAEILYS